MRASLVISLLLHVAIIVLAVISLRGPDKLLAPPQEALPVEIVNIEDVSKRTAMRKEAPKQPKKAPEKPAPPKEEKREVEKPAPKPAKEVKQAAREPEPAPEPKPEPKPAPKPEPKPAPRHESKPEAKPAPKPEPAPKPKAENKLDELLKKVVKETPPEEKKAEKPKKQAKARPAPKPRARPKIVRKKPKPKPKKLARAKPNRKPSKDPIDDIAALLNKVDDERAAPRQKSERTGTPLLGPANVNGDDARIAADIADALRARIEECWNIPAGVRDAERLQVRIRFQLGAGGEITGGPVVLNRMDHPAFPAAAQSAVRAIIACAPYTFLPPDRYDLWKDVILTFDPSRLLAVN